MDNSVKFRVASRNMGGEKVQSRRPEELVGIDAGVMMSLDFEQWAVESLDTALDWKRESRE